MGHITKPQPSYKKASFVTMEPQKTLLGCRWNSSLDTSAVSAVRTLTPTKAKSGSHKVAHQQSLLSETDDGFRCLDENICMSPCPSFQSWELCSKVAGEYLDAAFTTPPTDPPSMITWPEAPKPKPPQYISADYAPKLPDVFPEPFFNQRSAFDLRPKIVERSLFEAE
jgi:hypothetical protein